MKKIFQIRDGYNLKIGLPKIYPIKSTLKLFYRVRTNIPM